VAADVGAKLPVSGLGGVGAVHIAMDATGLKVFDAGEWLTEKLGARGRRTWCKLG
jgi:hypothetical protein